MKMKFSEVPIGARFTFLDFSYVKLALSLGEDDKGTGHVFGYDYEVESDAAPGPPLLPGPRPESDVERTLRISGK